MLAAVPARRAFVVFIACAMALSLIATLSSPVRAATITVTTTTDEYDAVANATCSLREAVVAANTDAAFGGCPAGSGADTITLPAGTYPLALFAGDGSGDSGPEAGDLDIRDDLTLTGAGASTTIIDGQASQAVAAGQGPERVIDMQGPDNDTTIEVTISGVTIQNGSWRANAGGVRADNPTELTMTDSVIKNNVSGGNGGGLYVHSNSTVTLRRVTVTGNSAYLGGGIYNNSDGEDGDAGSPGLLLEDSTISSNHAIEIETERSGHGGGVYNDDDTTLIRTTVNGNTADGSGGGVFNDGFDQSTEPPTATGARLTLTNSTISGNTAVDDGGGIFGGGELELEFSTIASNTAASPNGGGGIFLDSAAFAAFYASIMANNVPDDCNGDGTFESLGSNIDSDGNCGLDEDPSDKPDTDPKLGPLANNGGPTLTHALLFDSPAVDAVQDMVSENNVSGTCPATDQRGITRPQDGDSNGTLVCDIGAYELLPAAASITDVTVTEGNSGTVDAVFTVTLSHGSIGTVSFAYATANGTATVVADYQAATGTVTFVPGDVSETITVRVVGDTIVEPNETFVVNLSAPVGGTLADAQGTGTILDDDVAASISDVSVTEGNAGTTVNATFTVTLASASANAVTMSYATANGTAAAPADYQSKSGTVTFAPNDVSETITIAVVGDGIDELNETFVVNLSAPVFATLADAQGTGTILDDDAAAGALPDAATGKSDGNAASSGWPLALGLLLGIAALSLRRSRVRAPIRGR